MKGWPIVLLIFLTLDGRTRAATINSFVSNEGNAVVVLDGEIGEGDASRLSAVIDAANKTGRAVSGLKLNSPGGQIAEGVKLAEIIKTAKIATIVAPGKACASACFIAFAAGFQKFVGYQAAVGVHGASEQNGKETPRSHEATVTLARFVSELGVPPAIIGRMVVTPPNEIVWLTPDELKGMGTKLTDKAWRLAQPPFPRSPTGQPMQLPSGEFAGKRQEKISWEQFTQGAKEASASQNGYGANTWRICEPTTKICVTSLSYISKNTGKALLGRETEDPNGKVISREVCEFNDFGEVHECRKWDQSESNRMQSPLR